jgi:hypothetical protein
MNSRRGTKAAPPATPPKRPALQTNPLRPGPPIRPAWHFGTTRPRTSAKDGEPSRLGVDHCHPVGPR